MASALAVGLGVAAQIPLRGVHPPAAATALLITLGGMHPEAQAVGGVATGVPLTVLQERLFGPGDHPEERQNTLYVVLIMGIDTARQMPQASSPSND